MKGQTRLIEEFALFLSKEIVFVNESKTQLKVIGKNVQMQLQGMQSTVHALRKCFEAQAPFMVKERPSYE